MSASLFTSRRLLELPRSGDFQTTPAPVAHDRSSIQLFHIFQGLSQSMSPYPVSATPHFTSTLSTSLTGSRSFAVSLKAVHSFGSRLRPAASPPLTNAPRVSRRGYKGPPVLTSHQLNPTVRLHPRPHQHRPPRLTQASTSTQSKNPLTIV